MKDEICIGDKVIDSPVGAGTMTDITEAGYPQVNGIAVAWVQAEDGGVFDPKGVRPNASNKA